MEILWAFVFVLMLGYFFSLLPIIDSPFYKCSMLWNRAKMLIMVFPLDSPYFFVVHWKWFYLFQRYCVEDMDHLLRRFLSDWTCRGDVVASLWKFDNMRTFHRDFSIRTKLIVKNIEEPELVFAANCQVIATWMEWKCDEWLILTFLESKIKHSQQLTSITFIIPYPNRTVFVTTSCQQWSLQAQIHPRHWIIMKPLIQILKEDIFVLSLVCQISQLRHQFVQKYGRDVIVA